MDNKGNVKAVGDWTLDVRGVPFGGPINGRDLDGDQFNTKSNLHLDRYNPPVLYFHSYDDSGRPQGEPVEIGEILSHEVKADGVWFRVLLDKTQELAKRIWDAAKKGIAFASAGTADHLYRADPDGTITNFPLVELSLLDAANGKRPKNSYAVALPAMKAHYAKAGKSLPEQSPETDTGSEAGRPPESDGSPATPQRINSQNRKASPMTMPQGGQPPAQQPPAAPPPAKPQDACGVFELNGEYFVYAMDAQGEAAGNATAGPFATKEEAFAAMPQPGQQPPADPPPAAPTMKPSPVTKGNTMTQPNPETILVNKTEWDELNTTVKTLKAKVDAAPIVTGGAATPRDTAGPFRTLGEQLLAIKDVQLGRSGAEAARNKLDDVQKSIKATGASEQLGADMGFPLQQEFSNESLARVYTIGEIMKRVNKRTIGAGFNGIKVNVINETSRATGSRFGGVRAYWLNEGGTKTASRPSMRQFDLPLEKLIGLYYATDEILQDLTALESDVSDAFNKEIMFAAEDAIFNGSGGGMPSGIIGHAATVSVAAESGQSAATVLYKNLSKMYARLWVGDRAGAAWFINQDVTPTLDDLFQAVGTGGIPPYFVTYSPEGVMRIKGLPVITVEYAQSAGTVGDIVLGNFDAYRWIDKGGVKSDSSIHVAFVTDETAFRWVYRCNGKPFDISPLTPKNGTSTLAHFVTLATRS